VVPITVLGIAQIFDFRFWNGTKPGRRSIAKDGEAGGFCSPGEALGEVLAGREKIEVPYET
jgi:hypothetical protein